MNINFKMRGMDGVKKHLDSLPRGTKIRALEAIAKYLIGDNNHGLKYQPRRIYHSVDNPYKWTSEKQRRAYFATDGFGGGIPYQRTSKLKNGWSYVSKNSNWTSVTLVNDSGYAPFVQGDGAEMQRGHLADGWRRLKDVIKANWKGAVAAGQRAVDAWVRAGAK